MPEQNKTPQTSFFLNEGDDQYYIVIWPEEYRQADVLKRWDLLTQ